MFSERGDTACRGRATKQMNGGGLYPPASDQAYRARYNLQDGCGWGERFYVPVPPSEKPYAWQMSSRHNDGANLSFFDGHSKRVRRKWLEANSQIFHLDASRRP